MPSAQWLMKNYHRKWYPDETLDVAIGQGAVQATPLQLARIIGGHRVGRTPGAAARRVPGSVGSARFDKDLLESSAGFGQMWTSPSTPRTG